MACLTLVIEHYLSTAANGGHWCGIREVYCSINLFMPIVSMALIKVSSGSILPVEFFFLIELNFEIIWIKDIGLLFFLELEKILNRVDSAPLDWNVAIIRRNHSHDYVKRLRTLAHCVFKRESILQCIWTLHSCTRHDCCTVILGIHISMFAQCS